VRRRHAPREESAGVGEGGRMVFATGHLDDLVALKLFDQVRLLHAMPTIAQAELTIDVLARTVHLTVL
jgi:hypothetical protein